MTSFLSGLRPALLSALALLSLTSCSTIARYDQNAYANATAAKVETLTLMDKATGSYASHRADIEEVTLILHKSYEYDRGRSLNTESIQLWEQLLVASAEDPISGIYPRFLRRWKEQGRISPAGLRTFKPQTAQAFDKIIALENGKIH